jgi:hypothetical protein
MSQPPKRTLHGSGFCGDRVEVADDGAPVLRHPRPAAGSEGQKPREEPAAGGMMRDNGFGSVVKVALVLWTAACLYWCGDATLRSAQSLPTDEAAQSLHAFGFLFGTGLIFATWAGPALVMMLAYVVFGRSGKE